MKNKISILVMIMVVLAIFSVGALATIDSVVITQPLTADTLHGTAVEFNGTYTATGTVADSDLNVSIYMGQISGGVGQRVCSNTTLNLVGLTWACKVDLNTLNDNTSMSFNITVGNQTGPDGAGTTQQSSAQITGVINDDTVPIARFKTQELNAKTNGDLPVSCADSSDNIDGALTYQINLVKPTGANASTIITSSTGNFRGGDLDQTGVYTLSCVVQDNAPLTTYKGSVAIASPASANSNRATTSITVSSGGFAFQQAQAVATGGAGITPTTVPPRLIVLLLGIGVVALIIFGGKK